MRQPQSVIADPTKQQGFSLVIVLVMLIAIALIIVAGSQMINTDMRMGANDSDRQATMSLAEAALLHGEQTVVGITPARTPQVDCSGGGYCTPADPAGATEDAKKEAWKRTNILTGGTGDNSVVYSSGTTDTYQQPRYIIEPLGSPDSSGGQRYRVTARAWGRNPNTMVTVQSVVYSSP